MATGAGGPTTNGSLDLRRRTSALRQITRRSTREDLLNVFTPNSVVTTAAKFAGRERALEALINALLTEGAHAVVFGERGSGKSSLAAMFHNVAQGQLDILDYYGLRQSLERRGWLSFLVGPEPKTFNVIWVDGFGKTVDEVIHAILTRRPESGALERGPGLLAYLGAEADQVEVASRIGFDKVFTAGGEVKETFIPQKPVNVKEGFEIAVQRYSQTSSKDLLILIDEFETVRNKAEIAPYLKTVRRVRFVLVGIAQAAIELIGEHASIARDLHGILLPPMTAEELRFILQIGSYILSPVCILTDGAMDAIVRHSYGSPYWCHFLAKALVEQEIEAAGSSEAFLASSPPRRIDMAEVDALVSVLATRPDCSICEAALKQVTMGDERIGRVLRAIARIDDTIITSSAVARVVETEAAVSRDMASRMIEEMLRMPAGPFEERGRLLDTVSFAFRDPNFKRYILLRDAGLPLGS
jgi:hypothetical protein